MIWEILITIALPFLLTGWFSVVEYRRLISGEYFSISPTLLRIFIIAQCVYIGIFFMMTVAFGLEIIQKNVSGEYARLLIASADTANPSFPALILAVWSTYYLPLIFASVFTAIIVLGYMGRLVLVKYASDGTPPKHLNKFRFIFFVLAMTLIMPPLIFASLLLI